MRKSGNLGIRGKKILDLVIWACQTLFIGEVGLGGGGGGCQHIHTYILYYIILYDMILYYIIFSHTHTHTRTRTHTHTHIHIALLPY